MKNIHIFISLILLLSSIVGFSQKRRSSITGGKRYKAHNKSKHHKPINYINNWKGVMHLGTAKYTGDIVGRLEGLQKANFAIGLGAQYRFNELFSFRGDLNYIGLSGDDEFGINPHRNLEFYTHLIEGSVGATWDILKYNKMYRRRGLIAPYAYAGMGIMYFNPTATLNGETYLLAEYQTEGVSYSQVSFNLQFGGGIRFKVHPQLDIAVEAIYRMTFTDYLDDVSTIYPEDIADWTDPIRQQLSLRQEDKTYEQAAGGKRGGSTYDDGFITLGVRAEYTLRVSKQRYSLKRNTSRFRMHKGFRKKS